ncbi:kelch repeat-containing protein [Gadus macrocephalus]|uniref:kelch repeat-containing protein n=1 Tax=Gadus macrocephalus TaxID=80720 RepID=UPI0028CB50DC|nr:kelch repeat-containing protein [Gadus macrocephalus]
MDDFGVYAVIGLDNPPQRLLCPQGTCRTSLAVPPSARQVVLFTNGPWGERVCVNAELNDADRMPITIGKLTPYNKCLSWEQWEEEAWTDEVTLSITLEGGNLVKAVISEPKITVAIKEYTQKCTTAAPAAREVKGKRKRGRQAAEEEEEELEDERAAKRGEQQQEGEEENVCPNGRSEKKTPPGRKVRGHGRAGPRLLEDDPARMKMEANGTAEVKGIVGKTPPHRAGKPRGRPAKTPTQSITLASPSGRWGHTMCPIDAQTAIVIGGQGARMQFCKDPMWKLCTEDGSWAAAETLATGPTFEGRTGHTSVCDPVSGRIFVFGGSKNKKWFNDVHILDTHSWRWTMVEAQGKVPPLAYHSCSMFGGELFVLGGVFPLPHPQPDGCSDSLYIFDPYRSIWYQPIVTGDKPSPRSGHSACVMQKRLIYVFGGWDTPVCYNDMYTLDLGLMEFSAVKTTGKAPSPRSWHGSVALSDTQFLIHGGYNGHTALNDAFIFDIDTSCWSEVSLPEFSVSRAGHSIISMAMAADGRWGGQSTGAVAEEEEEQGGGASRSLLVFGGGDNEGKFYSDLMVVSIEELLGAVENS